MKQHKQQIHLRKNYRDPDIFPIKKFHLPIPVKKLINTIHRLGFVPGGRFLEKIPPVHYLYSIIIPSKGIIWSCMYVFSFHE